jgi:peptide chain release factor subunit 1
VAELGRIEEQTDLLDDVPGRHDQGGWSQARFQRHIDDLRRKHLKHTADVLFAFHKRRGFDHLILGGPEEVVADLERELHDYLTRRILARVTLPMTASPDEVMARSMEIEEERERERERTTVERLLADAAAGRLAVSGLERTLDVLGEGRAGWLVVRHDASAPGHECSACGRLGLRGGACRSCGGVTRAVEDVVEAAVAQAFRQGSRVEVITHDGRLADQQGIGALLRY